MDTGRLVHWMGSNYPHCKEWDWSYHYSGNNNLLDMYHNSSSLDWDSMLKLDRWLDRSCHYSGNNNRQNMQCNNSFHCRGSMIRSGSNKGSSYSNWGSNILPHRSTDMSCHNMGSKCLEGRQTDSRHYSILQDMHSTLRIRQCLRDLAAEAEVDASRFWSA